MPKMLFVNLYLIRSVARLLMILVLQLVKITKLLIIVIKKVIQIVMALFFVDQKIQGVLKQLQHQLNVSPTIQSAIKPPMIPAHLLVKAAKQPIFATEKITLTVRELFFVILKTPDVLKLPSPPQL